MESQGAAAFSRAGERRHDIGEQRGILRSLPEGTIYYDSPEEDRILAVFTHDFL